MSVLPVNRGGGEVADDRNVIAPVRISTAAFPAKRRLDMWREIYGRYMAHVDIVPIGDRPFHASAAFEN